MSAEEVATSPRFTGRQKEVFVLIGEGLSNKEIGERLGIDEKTVKAHVTAVLKALKVNSRARAVVMFYTRTDLVTPK